MSCCDRAKSVLKKGKHIAIGYTNLVKGKKYEFTDSRIRACHKCNFQWWGKGRVFCSIIVRRFGRYLWADPIAYIPGVARNSNGECPLGKWSN